MGRWVVAGLALASDCSGVWAENAPSGERGRLAWVHCYSHPLDCADAATLTCEEGCDVAFDACVGRSGEAGRSGRCQVDVVRCTRACAKEAPASSDTAAASRADTPPAPPLEAAVAADAPAPPADDMAPAPEARGRERRRPLPSTVVSLVNPACAGVSSAATGGCVGDCESEYEACRRAASSRSSNECSTAIMRCRRAYRDDARNSDQ